jgi:hypothetical protein
VQKSEGWKFLTKHDPWLELDILHFMDESETVCLLNICSLLFSSCHFDSCNNIYLLYYRGERNWGGTGRSRGYTRNWARRWNVWNIYVRKVALMLDHIMWRLIERGSHVANSQLVKVFSFWFAISRRARGGWREVAGGASECGSCLDCIHMFVNKRMIPAMFLFAG